MNLYEPRMYEKYDEKTLLNSVDDKPAKTYMGVREWYKNGVLHRENDLPAVVTDRGHKEWWVDGLRHRDWGPAIIRTNDVCSWYKRGMHIATY